jgi:hypothetical protein
MDPASFKTDLYCSIVKEMNRMSTSFLLGSILRRLLYLVETLVNGGYIDELVVDKFGNYFVQTLLANVPREAFNIIVDHLTSDPDRFAEICNHQFGSHVIQTAIHFCVGNMYSSAKLTKCISEAFKAISTKFLGSICVIHGIDSLSPSLGFAPTIAVNARLLAFSRHGHVILVHALQRFDEEFVHVVENAILKELEDFIDNDFGSRVLVHVLSRHLNTRVNTNTSFISSLVGEIKFKAKYFQLIEYLVTQFPGDPQVKNRLIPSIVRIVKAGAITANDQS